MITIFIIDMLNCDTCVSRLDTFLIIIRSVFTYVKPEKYCTQVTKYGGKIVCQPGTTDVAKSK
jgi:hypothetical protein